MAKYSKNEKIAYYNGLNKSLDKIAPNSVKASDVPKIEKSMKNGINKARKINGRNKYN